MGRHRGDVVGQPRICEPTLGFRRPVRHGQQRCRAGFERLHVHRDVARRSTRANAVNECRQTVRQGGVATRQVQTSTVIELKGSEPRATACLNLETLGVFDKFRGRPSRAKEITRGDGHVFPNGLPVLRRNRADEERHAEQQLRELAARAKEPVRDDADAHDGEHRLVTANPDPHRIGVGVTQPQRFTRQSANLRPARCRP